MRVALTNEAHLIGAQSHIQFGKPLKPHWGSR